MKENENNIVIYSRKSKFTGKGEGIGNQVELCKEYIQTHYPEVPQDHVFIYEDEGFPDWGLLLYLSGNSLTQELLWGVP